MEQNNIRKKMKYTFDILFFLACSAVAVQSDFIFGLRNS